MVAGGAVLRFSAVVRYAYGVHPCAASCVEVSYGVQYVCTPLETPLISSFFRAFPRARRADLSGTGELKSGTVQRPEVDAPKS